MPRRDTRQQLIDTAYARFKRDGFHAIGVDRIIAEAEVAKMTLYRNFPSKDDLIVAVLDQRADRFRKQLAILADASGPARDKIAAMFDWYENWMGREDFHGCIFAHAIAEYGAPDNSVHRRAARQKEEHRNCIAAILATELAGDRADRLALAILMLIEGATLLAQTEMRPGAVSIAREAALALLAAESAME